MTLPPLLPAIGEAAHWYYCRKCGEPTDHHPDGTCKDCGTKTPHVPREGENEKRRHA